MEYQPKLIPVAPVLLQKSSQLNFSFGRWGSWGKNKKKTKKNEKTVDNKLPGPPGPMDRQEGGRSVWSEDLIA